MSTLKKVSMLVAVAVALAATTAFAQRDAGAKMSGQFGTGFYARSATTYRWTPTYVAPAPVITRTAPVTQAPQVAQVPMDRRSFSLEPSVAPPTMDCVAPAPATAVAQAGPTVRRVYSYEPAPAYTYRAPAYRRGGMQTPSYMLPKTDPRKYGGF
jgi:hypothetical protein